MGFRHKYIAFLLCILLAGCTPKNNHSFKKQLDSECRNGDCKYYAINLKGKRIFITSFPKEPDNVKFYNSTKILSVKFSCGNPCNYTYYVDLRNNRVSNGFFGVLDFDSNNAVVAYVDSDYVGICPIFNPERQTVIRKSFAPVASLCSAISSLKFVDGSAIIMSYLKGETYAETTETIKFK